MFLSDLKTGEIGVIVKVNGSGAFRKRILEMGFIKGKAIKVILNAPLKDPIKYKIMDYEVSLRRSEAKLIEVIYPKDKVEKKSLVEEKYSFENNYDCEECVLKKAPNGTKQITIIQRGCSEEQPLCIVIIVKLSPRSQSGNRSPTEVGVTYCHNAGRHIPARVCGMW